MDEVVRTRDFMAKRGPDGAGAWMSPDQRLAFGHRRLSIVDLSESGSQPMSSADGKTIVTFNGEIYNYPELRLQLEARGRIFLTHCDTEVLLHLYELEGTEMVHALRGMFAFAIWDVAKAGLFLARDPYGIKPLYTANDGWAFRFASQVKALLAGGRVSQDPEPAGIVGFHLWGTVPEPFTLFREIRCLPAGCSQWVDATGARPPRLYASVAQALKHGERSSVHASEFQEMIRDSLRASVKAHLLADVPVGIFLSSGVDSGAVLGLMRDAGHNDTRAITLAFEEFAGTSEDETPLAAETAKRYGAEHIVRRVSHAEFDQDLPSILGAMDQPSIDGVNTWFVSKAAREAGLKVALSGLGGDELLAGYPSFMQIPGWVSRLRLPAAIPGLGILSRKLGVVLQMGGNAPKRLGVLEYGGSYAGAYFLKRALFLPFELETQLDPSLLAAGLRRLRVLQTIEETCLRPRLDSAVSKIVALESSCYLRNQLLRDNDWAGMAHSVEIRTPLVDFQLLRALSPVVPYLSAGLGKRYLANSPSQALPSTLLSRPKTGFGVPTARWMASASSNRDPAPRGLTSRAWAGLVGQSFIPALAAA